MKLIRNTKTGEEFHASTAAAKDLAAAGEFEFVEVVEVIDSASDLDAVPTETAGQDEPAEVPADLSDLKKGELVDLAEEQGIEVPSKATKDDLIEAIEAAGQGE